MKLVLPNISEGLDTRVAFIGKVLRVDQNHWNVGIERIEDWLAQRFGIVELDRYPIGFCRDIRLHELSLHVDVATFQTAIDRVDAQILARVRYAALQNGEELNRRADDEMHIKL